MRNPQSSLNANFPFSFNGRDYDLSSLINQVNTIYALVELDENYYVVANKNTGEAYLYNPYSSGVIVVVTSKPGDSIAALVNAKDYYKGEHDELLLVFDGIDASRAAYQKLSSVGMSENIYSVAPYIYIHTSEKITVFNYYDSSDHTRVNYNGFLRGWVLEDGSPLVRPGYSFTAVFKGIVTAIKVTVFVFHTLPKFVGIVEDFFQPPSQSLPPQYPQTQPQQPLQPQPQPPHPQSGTSLDTLIEMYNLDSDWVNTVMYYPLTPGYSTLWIYQAGWMDSRGVVAGILHSSGVGTNSTPPNFTLVQLGILDDPITQSRFSHWAIWDNGVVTIYHNPSVTIQTSDRHMLAIAYFT
jgi:hypothetical protein